MVSEGVRINPGTSAAQLESFEVRYSLRLPNDLREYFSAMNGMQDGDWDENCFTFLPLDEVKAVTQEIAKFGGIPDYREIVRTLPDSENWYVIVNYLISSAVCAIRMARDDNENPVILIRNGTSVSAVASSFEGFLRTYLTDIGSLF